MDWGPYDLFVLGYGSLVCAREGLSQKGAYVRCGIVGGEIDVRTCTGVGKDLTYRDALDETGLAGRPVAFGYDAIELAELSFPLNVRFFSVGLDTAVFAMELDDAVLVSGGLVHEVSV